MTAVPEAESASVGSPDDAQSVTRKLPSLATGVAPEPAGEESPQALSAATRRTEDTAAMLPRRVNDIPAGYATDGYILARRRSTRSSTLAKGSLHSTVRWAWSFNFRCTQSTVKSRRRS